MKISNTPLLLIFLLICLSCRQESERHFSNASRLYIDSLKVNHYKKRMKPYLLSSTTYAYNDSMSQVLDTLNLDLLTAMNSTDRSYDEPLLYDQYSDTIVVDLIYSRGRV